MTEKNIFENVVCINAIFICVKKGNAIVNDQYPNATKSKCFKIHFAWKV